MRWQRRVKRGARAVRWQRPVKRGARSGRRVPRGATPRPGAFSGSRLGGAGTRLVAFCLSGSWFLFLVSSVLKTIAVHILCSFFSGCVCIFDSYRPTLARSGNASAPADSTAGLPSLKDMCRHVTPFQRFPLCGTRASAASLPLHQPPNAPPRFPAFPWCRATGS